MKEHRGTKEWQATRWFVGNHLDDSADLIYYYEQTIKGLQESLESYKQALLAEWAKQEKP